MKEQKQKPIYFNVENFVQMVLKETAMDKAEPSVVEELGLEIANTLSKRITATVIASLGDKELFLLEKTLEDHPELDRIDALSIITSYVPGLNDRILKEVSDLFDELVDNVKEIDKHLNNS
ncbi:MAG TPA: hypothetical protein VGO21_04240 [Candidatus Paceibacterota bacterium]|nr:hypothetical protein [Candidatus Paceibacterota bacterium]